MNLTDKQAITPLISDQQKRILATARDTYGETGQILVALEELCELSAVCAKYPRYDDKNKAEQELHAKAVDEVADVLVVLDHIVNIFKLDPEEIRIRIAAKVERLERWLAASSTMEQTTVDRAVVSAGVSISKCETCDGRGNFENLIPGHRCIRCHDSGGAYYRPKEG